MRSRFPALLATFFIIAITCSCSTSRDATKIEYRDREVIKIDSIRDSIFVHDSTIVREKGDTVFVEKYRDRWRTKIQIKIDTMRDTTTLIQENTKTITKIDRRPSPFLIFVACIIEGVILLFVVPRLVEWWRRLKR